MKAINATKDRDGVTKISRGKAFKVTEIKIAEDRHGVPIGKKKGRYITLEGAPLGRFSESFKDMACELSEELSQLVPKGPALVIGTGKQRYNAGRVRSSGGFKGACHKASAGGIRLGGRVFVRAQAGKRYGKRCTWTDWN